MSCHGAIAAAALSLATPLLAGFASAADLPVKAAVKAAPDVPFFSLTDNRVTYSYIFSGTDPGVFSIRPEGSINGKTAKQVYSLTHFDAWAYGTNFFAILMYKSGHNDPASPCTNAGVVFDAGIALRHHARRRQMRWPVGTDHGDLLRGGIEQKGTALAVCHRGDRLRRRGGCPLRLHAVGQPRRRLSASSAQRTAPAFRCATRFRSSVLTPIISGRPPGLAAKLAVSR